MKVKDTPEEFQEKVLKRQRSKLRDKSFDIAKLAKSFQDYYKQLNNDSRRAYVRKTVTMYANYENKFYGYVDQSGEWQDYRQYDNDYTFSVPLFKAHVDTGITFYSKATPQYVARPVRSDYRTLQLAKMCQALGGAELRRMFTKSDIQREALNLFLAGDSYRQITNEISDDSPMVVEKKVTKRETAVPLAECLDCGEVGPAGGDDEICPGCLSDNMEVSEEMVEHEVTESIPRRLPRPQVHIPNPVMIQTDQTATDSGRGFLIKRQKVRTMIAEYLYQTDLSSTDESADFASDTLERQSKLPVTEEGASNTLLTSSELGSYIQSMNKMVGEQEFWLDPSEYGLYFTNEGSVVDQFPTGLYLHTVGDNLVDHQPAVRRREWIRLTAGLRPAANDGTGMYHLASLNDLINNGINLEYAILKTVGFPTTLIRTRYLSKNPSALDVLLLDNIPDEVSLDNVIHRVPAQNASGMLGILSQRFEGYMQYVGGTWSPIGGAADIREVMGTATGASAVQEMMSDRLGLAVQMRVQADIETLYSVLEYIQLDRSEGNVQLLSEEYGEAVVKTFFESDIRATVTFEAAKGTDEPQMDSVTAFKAQTFGGIVTSMTGIREFDKAFFYDMVAMLGEAFNLPTNIGTGRKEKEVAKNWISLIQLMYKEKYKGNGVDTDMGEDVRIGQELFVEVTREDAILTELLPSLQFELYDFEAMKETFSDWLQSNEGQNSPMAIRVAVASLFDYSVQALMGKQMQAFEMQMQQQQMLAGATATNDLAEGQVDGEVEEDGRDLDSESEGEVPDDVKRDGSKGPGRPRDFPDPEEPDVLDTGGNVADLAFDRGVPQGGGTEFALGDTNA